MKIKNLIRKNIQSMVPYTSARDEFDGEAEVYLDANESPFKTDSNRYPDPLQRKVKEQIALLKGIDTSSIFLGNGSDEAIDLLIRAFCKPGEDSILVTEPTYGMYEVCARVQDVGVNKTRLTDDFDLQYEVIKSLNNDSVKIIFICSPNNPTGNVFDKANIIKLLEEFQGLVVVDEAYIDFADDVGFLPVIGTYKNLVVLQTFSKAWGLAGIRLGMCFADREIIDVLNKIKYPYNINSVTQRIALDSIQYPERVNSIVEMVLKEREMLNDELSKMKMVEKVFPSQANFLLVRFKDAKVVYNYLREQRIIVRDRSSTVLCENCLRITVGTEEENRKLVNALKIYEQKESTLY